MGPVAVCDDEIREGSMRHIKGIALGCSLALAAIALCWGWAPPAAAQQAAPDPDVVQIRPNFWVIGGGGSNVVVQVGPEGVILVDSGTAAASSRVLAAIKRITELPIRYIINTSMDADHVGGNETLTKAGLSILP